MKGKLAILLFLCVCIVGYSQETAYDKGSFKQNKIKVQIVYEHSFVQGTPADKGKKIQENFFDKDGNKIQEVNYRFNGTVHSVHTYKYDLKGRKIEFIKYEGNKDKMIFRQYYYYDSKGNLNMEVGFNGVENYKTEYKFDANNRITEVIYYLDNRVDEKRMLSYVKNTSETKVLDGTQQFLYKIAYTYNATGQITSETKTESTGVVSKKVNYTYDAKGNLLTEEKYLNGKLASKVIKVYDAKYRLLEVYNETAPNSKFLVQKYIYNASGLLTEEQYRTQPTKDFSKNTYQYLDNGVCKSVESYYASYKEQVMYVYNYEKY